MLRFWRVSRAVLGVTLAFLVVALVGHATTLRPVAADPACSPGANHPGNIVVNGSFETPCLPANTYADFASIPGWTAVAVTPTGNTQQCPAVIELDTGPAVGVTPADGNQSVELNANCPSGIEQTLTTAPNTTYVLRFAFAARPQCPGQTSLAPCNMLDVYWNGTPIAPTLTSTTTSYVYYTYAVTATGTSTKLDFYSGSTVDTSYGTEIDDVSVVVMTKDMCKDGGWQQFSGQFKNQGDCVSFVATNGRNTPG